MSDGIAWVSGRAQVPVRNGMLERFVEAWLDDRAMAGID
jgi:hypothetical protein